MFLFLFFWLLLITASQNEQKKNPNKFANLTLKALKIVVFGLNPD